MAPIEITSIDPDSLRGYLVFIDIDGTLTVDGGSKVASPIQVWVKNLASVARVHLISNRKDHHRNTRIAQMLGVFYLETGLRKPNPEIFKQISGSFAIPCIVIGDKCLTDGLFAKKIGAKFLKVRRMVGPRESIFIRFLYFIDDIAAFIVSC